MRETCLARFIRLFQVDSVHTLVNANISPKNNAGIQKFKQHILNNIFFEMVPL
jgi:hypothetical protein